LWWGIFSGFDIFVEGESNQRGERRERDPKGQARGHSGRRILWSIMVGDAVTLSLEWCGATTSTIKTASSSSSSTSPTSPPPGLSLRFSRLDKEYQLIFLPVNTLSDVGMEDEGGAMEAEAETHAMEADAMEADAMKADAMEADVMEADTEPVKEGQKRYQLSTRAHSCQQSCRSRTPCVCLCVLILLYTLMCVCVSSHYYIRAVCACVLRAKTNRGFGPGATTRQGRRRARVAGRHDAWVRVCVSVEASSPSLIWINGRLVLPLLSYSHYLRTPMTCVYVLL
jgi:hypothetical protein